MVVAMKWTTTVLLLSLAMFVNNGACQDTSPRCKSLLDVVAVVDGSDSISDGEFLTLKAGLIQISEALGLNRTGPKFGVVVYSSVVSETAPLTSDTETLKSQISGFVHPMDGTATHLGIQNMTDMMEKQGRVDVPKVGIVITDGRSKKPAETQTAAAAARNASIKMFAVGVGSTINQTELKGIASRPENVLELVNFDDLLKNVLSLVQKVCKVDGNWSEWTVTTGSCSVTCGGGSRTITRNRTCTNPSPSNGGLDCKGNNIETVSEACNTGGCPVNGNLGEWVETSTACSASCGGGSRTITRNRTCTNPSPSTSKTHMLNGNWGEWVETPTACSVSCGGGSRTITRNRTCTNPSPSNGGLDCKGNNIETVSEACNTGGCPVNGNWGEWVETSTACSASCGGGSRTITGNSTCTNPSPSTSKTHMLNGNWGEWVETPTACSASCGGGSRTITRNRTCTNPSPSNGGLDCKGNNIETVSEACNTGGCPVNGNWGEWVETSTACSASCGGGSRTITGNRTCTNPSPSTSKTHMLNGNWGEWVETPTACSASCGGGSRTITRNRTCTNPSPSNGGLDCKGNNIETVSEACNTGGCPVNGNWGEWVETSTVCSASCGGGSRTITRIRTCTNPPPSIGGDDCEGESIATATQGCNAEECEVPADLCDDCTYFNGIGYVPYPSDRSKYVQCSRTDKPVVMPCGPGTMWNQTFLTCLHASSDSSSSSLSETTAAVAAETTTTSTGTTKCREVAGNRARYDEHVSGHGWVRRLCAPGTELRLAKCDCVVPKVPAVPRTTTTSVPLNPVCQPEVYLPCDRDLKDNSGRHNYIQNENVTITDGVAVFTRDSGLRIPRFSNVDFGSTLVISFLLRRGERTERAQAIVSNADCKRRGSLYIAQTSSTVKFIVLTKHGKKCTISLPYTSVVGLRGREMTACSLTVDGGYMTAKVGVRTKTIPCPGDIARSHCAMQVGRGTGYDNFTGELAKFTVSICRPDFVPA